MLTQILLNVRLMYFIENVAFDLSMIILLSSFFKYLFQENPSYQVIIYVSVSELLPPLPGDGVFAVDALLCGPGTIVKDPVVWQWQDDRGTWHTYGYNDCR